MQTTILFGGTGFIGTHVAQHLVKQQLAKQIILVDIKPPSHGKHAELLREGLARQTVRYVKHDVRYPVPQGLLPEDAEVIFNLAAVHREPGHRPEEYYETNLYGAENVCDYASAIRCRRLVFTSSISPYGPSEELRHEGSLPVPATPYGGSKLVAEKIHLAWQSSHRDRRLVILRPGVVFGPGEDGNVTRLIRSLLGGYFFYMGNRDTRKAGGYVKELVLVAQFALEHQDRTGEATTLINFSMDPPASIESYVDAIRKVAGIRRAPLSVPRSVIVSLSYPIAWASASGIQQAISPVRVRKLLRSTNIEPRRLRELGYEYKYQLVEALEDWKQDVPTDFVR